MESSRTAALAEGALTASLIGAFSLVKAFAPPLGILLFFFCPVPLVVLILRHGLRIGAMSWFVAFWLTLFLSGPVNAVMFLLGFGLMGIFLGAGMERKIRATWIVFVSAVIAVFAWFLFLYLFKTFFELDLAGSVKQWLASPPKWLTFFMDKDLASETAFVFHYIFPGLCALGAYFLCVVYYKVCEEILRQLSLQAPPFPKIRDWKLQRAVSLLFFISIFEFRYKWGGEAVFLFFLNLRLVLSVLFFVHGVALVMFFLIKYKTLGKRLSFAVFFIVFFPLYMGETVLGDAAVFFMITGVLDAWLDFRGGLTG